MSEPLDTAAIRALLGHYVGSKCRECGIDASALCDEVDRLRAERDALRTELWAFKETDHLAAEVERLTAERDHAEAKLAAVRDLCTSDHIWRDTDGTWVDRDRVLALIKTEDDRGPNQ